MYEKTLLAHKRFSANMRRVNNLTALAVSNQGKAGFFTYDGVSADLFRAIVVLLHAAVEDLVRVHVTRDKFTFSGANDIIKRLRKAGFDPSPLEHLRKPLQQFAERRHRIVHFGDLRDSADEVEAWGVADVWMLIQWQLSVMAFLYKFLEIVTEPTELFTHRYNAARKALNENVKLGHELANFGQRLPRPLNSENAHEAKAALTQLGNRLSEIARLVDEIST